MSVAEIDGIVRRLSSDVPRQTRAEKTGSAYRLLAQVYAGQNCSVWRGFGGGKKIYFTDGRVGSSNLLQRPESVNLIFS